jgi:hypothetical protein
MEQFIFFIAYNGPNKLEFYITLLERLTRDKDSSLLDPLVSYKENEVL